MLVIGLNYSAQMPGTDLELTVINYASEIPHWLWYRLCKKYVLANFQER